MSDRSKLISKIILDFAAIEPGDADHIARMIDSALEADAEWEYGASWEDGVLHQEWVHGGFSTPEAVEVYLTALFKNPNDRGGFVVKRQKAGRWVKNE